MKSKHYTAPQAAKLLRITEDAIRQQLYRDTKKLKHERKYPNAYKTECCGAWVIPGGDLK